MKRVVALSILLLVMMPQIGLKDGVTPQPAGLAAAPPLGATDYPWMMFHHDSLRSGASPASAPGVANPAWSYATGGVIYASPAVADGTVFISSWDGGVYALNENTGAQIWSVATGGSIYSSPAVSNGIVYVGSRNGGMYALNEQTGGLIWVQGNSNEAITSSPAVADGKVFYGTWCQGGCFNPGEFVARYANNGTLFWLNATIPSSSVRSSPSVDSGLVFFGQDNGLIVALNEATGKQVWARTLNGVTVLQSAAAVANGRLFIGTDNGFFELNELTGARITPFVSPAANTTSAAVSNGAVYFGSGNGYVYKVNATTGTLMWRTSPGTGAAINSSPALALGTNTLLVGCNDGSLYALNMTNGGFVWRYATGAQVYSSPAVADGRAFVASQDSKIYTIGTAPPPSPSLKAQIFPSISTLRPGQQSALTITVTNGTVPESGVNLTLSSTVGGGFTLPVEKTPGVYASNYTAPLTFSSTFTTIRVVAAKLGFLNGAAQTTVTLQPFPPLTVSFTVDQTSISPGTEVRLQIRVLNGTRPVVGATVIPFSTGGGSFSSVVDAGNGNYSSVYSSSIQDSGSSTLTVQVAKLGFSPAQSEVTISVAGFPDIAKSKVYGLPILLLAAAGLAICLIVIGAFASKKRKVVGQAPAPVSYALDLRCFFPGRLN